MDLQQILVIVIFLAALYYVGKKVYSSVFPSKGNCSTGCNKCAANFEQIPNAPKE